MAFINYIIKNRIFIFVVIFVLLFGCAALKPYSSVDLPPKTVMLTFDDGPNAHNNVTDSVLDVLKRHDIKAYFCLIGMNVECHPSIVKRIYDEGHYLANHGYTDEFVVHKRNRDIKNDIIKCNSAIGKALEIENYHVKYYRPPRGFYRASSKRVWQELDMELLPFTMYALDAQRNGDKADIVIKETIKEIEKKNGGIIILHDGRDCEDRMLSEIEKDSTLSYNRSWIPEAVDSIVTILKRDGFVFK